jgi:hypothetical protein
MPRVVCWQADCLYNVDGKCRAVEIEFDPVDGCLTMALRDGTDEVEEDDTWERGGMHVMTDEE